jgi:hypothetical protein
MRKQIEHRLQAALASMLIISAGGSGPRTRTLQCCVAHGIALLPDRCHSQHPTDRLIEPCPVSGGAQRLKLGLPYGADDGFAGADPSATKATFFALAGRMPPHRPNNTTPAGVLGGAAY